MQKKLYIYIYIYMFPTWSTCSEMCPSIRHQCVTIPTADELMRCKICFSDVFDYKFAPRSNVTETCWRGACTTKATTRKQEPTHTGHHETPGRNEMKACSDSASASAPKSSQKTKNHEDISRCEWPCSGRTTIASQFTPYHPKNGDARTPAIKSRKNKPM